MKRIRCALLVALLLVTAAAAAPAAAAPEGSPGWTLSWWQGLAAWAAERLPFAGWLTAASEDDGTAPDEGETLPPEDDGSDPGLMLLDPDGEEDGSGGHWDPDG